MHWLCLQTLNFRRLRSATKKIKFFVFIFLRNVKLIEFRCGTTTIRTEFTSPKKILTQCIGWRYKNSKVLHFKGRTNQFTESCSSLFLRSFWIRLADCVETLKTVRSSEGKNPFLIFILKFIFLRKKELIKLRRYISRVSLINENENENLFYYFLV